MAGPDGRQSSERAGHHAVLERYSPQVQAAVSAVLLVPTLVVFFVAWQVIPTIHDQQARGTGNALFTLVYSAYFVVVISFVARNPQLRVQALRVAIVAATVDTAYTWYDYSPGALGPVGLSHLIYALLCVAYVTAWGIARRQHRNWKIGVALATIVAGVCQFVTPIREGWLTAWALYVGAFVIGCLICLAFDVGIRFLEPERQTSP